MWCQPMDYEDIYSLAEKCWKVHTCEGFSVFRRKSDGAWMHCMKRTGGLFADVVDWDDLVSPPASWEQDEYCNGVYVLAGGSGWGAVQVVLLPACCSGRRAAAASCLCEVRTQLHQLSSVAREAAVCGRLLGTPHAAAAAVAQSFKQGSRVALTWLQALLGVRKRARRLANVVPALLSADEHTCALRNAERRPGPPIIVDCEGDLLRPDNFWFNR